MFCQRFDSEAAGIAYSYDLAKARGDVQLRLLPAQILYSSSASLTFCKCVTLVSCEVIRLRRKCARPTLTVGSDEMTGTFSVVSRPCSGVLDSYSSDSIPDQTASTAAQRRPYKQLFAGTNWRDKRAFRTTLAAVRLHTRPRRRD